MARIQRSLITYPREIDWNLPVTSAFLIILLDGVATADLNARNLDAAMLYRLVRVSEFELEDGGESEQNEETAQLCPDYFRKASPDKINDVDVLTSGEDEGQ